MFPYHYMYQEINQKLGLTNYAYQYHVDCVNGVDTNHGRDWAHAFRTIQAAIDAHGVHVNEDWNDKRYDIIWVKPGVYAENLVDDPVSGGIFHCHIIGLGLHGSDSQAEIHPPTGSCFAGTVNGLHLANMWLEVDEKDASILDFVVCNNTVIEDCVFSLGADVTGVIGIDTENSAWLVVRRCRFTSGRVLELGYGIYNRAGMAHNNQYHDNYIKANTAGIYINASNGEMTIKHNSILVETSPGHALAGIGIDDNHAGNYSFCIDNWIAADDAIAHPNTATYCIANHIIETAAAGVETNLTD